MTARWPLSGVTKVLRTALSVCIPGSTIYASSVCPGVFMGLAAGQSAQLVECRAQVSRGSLTFKLQRNGTDIPGFGTTGSPLTASTTSASTSPTAVALADGDYLTAVVIGVSNPANLAVSLIVEDTV